MKTYQLLLGSGSPRRRDLIESLGWSFERVSIHCAEDHPEILQGAEIACYLAQKKSMAYAEELGQNELLLTADTVVWYDGVHLAKPENRQEAISMLFRLSGSIHEVITGVAIRTAENIKVFSETTRVHFCPLKDEQIEFYVDHYQPFDKAGAYGIQEWIGMVGIPRIEGCYFNVVGLPVQRLVSEIDSSGMEIATRVQ